MSITSKFGLSHLLHYYCSMISEFSRSSNKYINIGIIIILIITSIMLMEDDFEFPAMLFFYSALVFMLYLIFNWYKKRGSNNLISKPTRKREIKILSVLISTISVIAIVEASSKSIDKTLLLSQILAFSVLIGFSEQFSKSIFFQTLKSKKLYIAMAIIFYSIFTFLFTLLVYEAEEIINLFALGFFVVLLVFGTKWLVNQIKFILNLKNEKAKTELMHLQSQVNPHFFFNVLNNLYGTVGKDPKQAQEIILKLSDMMRYSIYNGQKERATLQEEIDHLKNYIALNKMRYHKIIDIDFDINISNNEVKIVPLLYLMLLENAFKHGAEKLRKDAFIKIRIENIENALNFTVINNYDTTAVAKQKGIGLNNLKRRLELAYPENHELKLLNKNGIFEAHLNLNIL